MTLRFEEVDGEYCPVFACDECGQPCQGRNAPGHKASLIQWDYYENPTWVVLHKGQCLSTWEYKNQPLNGPNGWRVKGWCGWRDLDVFAAQLKNNTWYRFDEELPEQVAKRRREARKGGPAWTYYVQGPDGNIKIGMSANIRGRLLTLNGGVVGADHVQLLAVEFEDVERARHQQFSHLRLKGEWFEPGPELLSHLESLASSLQRFEAETQVAS